MRQKSLMSLLSGNPRSTLRCMQSFSTEQARAKLGDILQTAAAGESVLITYRGAPIALVVPVAPPPHPVVHDGDAATATESHRH